MLTWALSNTYRVEDLQAIGEAYGERARKAAAGLPRALRALLGPGSGPPPASAGRLLDARMGRDLAAGRVYGAPRIRELKTLRAEGRLLPEGLAVKDLACVRRLRK